MSDEGENGAVAQLGERLGGIEEAGGSSPPSSTISENEEFRAEQEVWQQACADAYWRLESQVSDEMTEDSLTGRALELADLVSSMIWGGARGWERATKEQFEHLKREARKRMKV